jgi:hypothetical protein
MSLGLSPSDQRLSGCGPRAEGRGKRK